MDRYVLKNVLVLTFLLSIPFHYLSAYSDPVSNVRCYRVTDEKIVIYYDLSGSETWTVSVKVSLDSGKTFPLMPVDLSGDVGKNVTPGSYKRIVWNVSTDNITLLDVVVIKVVAHGDSLVEPVLTAEDKQKTFTAHFLQSPVILDGLSDEPAWNDIEPLPVVMQNPDFGSEPTERTEILLAYDDDYLYVAGRLYDRQPSKIHNTTNKRDDWNDSSDHFGIIIDTFNDKENALAFITTPSGQRIDLTVHDTQSSVSSDTNWNTFWDVKKVCNGDGWFVEMRIPFSSIRFQERNGRVVMSVIAYRWIARKRETVVFPIISHKWGARSFLKVSHAREVVFESIQSHKPLYVTPYILGGIGHAYELNGTGTAYKRSDDPAHQAGLDIKHGLTSNLTLDATVNTDFAQVEADDQQVNLTRYSLFFPEKRLFFQERSSNFDFNFYGTNRLFHSRRIGIYNGKRVRIYGGARLVGRVGPWDLGILSMQTEPVENLTSENFGVLRVRRQVINPNSYVGGIVTSRIGVDNTYNTAYGLDGIFHLFGDDYLKLNWAQTFEKNRENNPASLEPTKVRAYWVRQLMKGFSYGLNYSRTGADYNPGMGFERHENYSHIDGFVRYGWMLGEQSILLRHRFYADWLLFFRNPDSTTESAKIGGGWVFTTKSGYDGSIVVSHFFEDVGEPFSFSENADVPVGKYTFYGLTVRFGTPAGGLNRIETTLDAGSFYDGRRVSLSLSPTCSISSNLELGGSYQLNRVTFPEREQQFTSHIGRFRVLAMLGIKFSVTSFLQYNSAADVVIANVRFRYNPREGNDLYLVYDEGLNTNREREDPILPVTSNRTLMLKYSYMFNL